LRVRRANSKTQHKNCQCNQLFHLRPFSGLRRRGRPASPQHLLVY
jgi:hypothetical protein